MPAKKTTTRRPTSASSKPVKTATTKSTSRPKPRPRPIPTTTKPTPKPKRGKALKKTAADAARAASKSLRRAAKVAVKAIRKGTSLEAIDTMTRLVNDVIEICDQILGDSVKPITPEGAHAYPYALGGDTDFMVVGKSNGMFDCQINLPESLTKEVDAWAERLQCESGDIINMALLAAINLPPAKKKKIITRMETDRARRGLQPLSREAIDLSVGPLSPQKHAEPVLEDLGPPAP